MVPHEKSGVPLWQNRNSGGFDRGQVLYPKNTDHDTNNYKKRQSIFTDPHHLIALVILQSCAAHVSRSFIEVKTMSIFYIIGVVVVIIVVASYLGVHI